MAKNKTDPEASAEASEGSAVLVTAPGGPRRRAGIEFGPQERRVPRDALSEEGWRAIEADPLLVVRPARSEATSAA